VVDVRYEKAPKKKAGGGMWEVRVVKAATHPFTVVTVLAIIIFFGSIAVVGAYYPIYEQYIVRGALRSTV